MAERRSLDTESWAKLEQKIRDSKVLSNAFRLMTDASMLCDASRYASTVALASVALEEIGKYLLMTWSNSDPLFSYDRRRQHVMKQCAVSAAFMADSARLECKSKGIDFQNLKTVADFEELATAALAGLDREKNFANAALKKVMEVVKWSGLYYDEEYAIKGIEPDKISKESAGSMMEMLSKAFMVIADDKNVAVAMHAFPLFYKTQLSPL